MFKEDRKPLVEISVKEGVWKKLKGLEIVSYSD